MEPERAQVVLGLIRELYQLDEQHRQRGLEGDERRTARLEQCQPVVRRILAWCEAQPQTGLLPDDALTKVVNHTLKRRNALQVFLENPDVPLGTNHLERQLRVIPIGKGNGLFAWTELGAEHIGIIQNLLRTCKLQGIDPYIPRMDRPAS